MAEIEKETKVFTVSEFVQHINALFEDEAVYIEGEISRLNVKGNHLVFFTLVDKKSAVDCFTLDFRIHVPIEEGMKVQIVGRPGLYARSGRFRVDVYDLKPSGEGALSRAFELLKTKLEAEGLFDTERKRLLPQFPQCIGLITSSDAAAYTDFLKVLRERWGGLSISLFDVPVQGRSAVRAIFDAFQWFNAHARDYDLIVLTRGGGSLEDLLAFNSEEVARAVFSSKVPVVVGVGHERDVSLADFVADVRASTPSNAAELIVPHRREIAWQVDTFLSRIRQSLDAQIADKDRKIGGYAADILQAVHLHSLRLAQKVRSVVYYFYLFQDSLRRSRMRTEDHVSNIINALARVIEKQRMFVSMRERVLAALSPESTLKRGYSIVFKKGTERIVRDAREVEIREKLDIRLARGTLESEVTRRGT